jgi:hypothetical protein
MVPVQHGPNGRVDDASSHKAGVASATQVHEIYRHHATEKAVWKQSVWTHAAFSATLRPFAATLQGRVPVGLRSISKRIFFPSQWLELRVTFGHGVCLQAEASVCSLRASSPVG